MRPSLRAFAAALAFGLVSLASAQDPNLPSRNFSPGNISSAMTGVKATDLRGVTPDGKVLPRGTLIPAENASRASNFRLSGFFPRLTGLFTRGSSSATPGVPNRNGAFQPVMPVMSTVDNPGRAITGLGSAQGVRGGSFQLPVPITGR